MYKAKKFISYMALCVLIFSLCACGEKGSENAAIYGETVGELEDNELFAIIDTNASLPVLNYTRAWESLGFAHKKGCANVLTPHGIVLLYNQI